MAWLNHGYPDRIRRWKGLPETRGRRHPGPMFSDLVAFLAGWVKGLLDSWGYWGIVFAMAIESACIPLPSEVIMPAAGVLPAAFPASASSA